MFNANILTMTFRKANFIAMNVEFAGKEEEKILSIVKYAWHAYQLKDLTSINAWRRRYPKSVQYASKINLAQLSLQCFFYVVIPSTVNA